MNIFQKLKFKHNIKKLEDFSFTECLNEVENVINRAENVCENIISSDGAGFSGNYWMKGCGFLTVIETKKYCNAIYNKLVRLIADEFVYANCSIEQRIEAKDYISAVEDADFHISQLESKDSQVSYVHELIIGRLNEYKNDHRKQLSVDDLDRDKLERLNILVSLYEKLEKAYNQECQTLKNKARSIRYSEDYIKQKEAKDKEEKELEREQHKAEVEKSASECYKKTGMTPCEYNEFQRKKDEENKAKAEATAKAEEEKEAEKKRKQELSDHMLEDNGCSSNYYKKWA